MMDLRLKKHVEQRRRGKDLKCDRCRWTRRKDQFGIVSCQTQRRRRNLTANLCISCLECRAAPNLKRRLPSVSGSAGIREKMLMVWRWCRNV